MLIKCSEFFSATCITFNLCHPNSALFPSFPGSSLQSVCYFYPGVSKPSQGLPQFIALGHLDNQLFVHYDSNTQKYPATVTWVKEVEQEDLGGQHLDCPEEQDAVEKTPSDSGKGKADLPCRRAAASFLPQAARYKNNPKQPIGDDL
uniref:MHC class I-like antigen recognition-like domain-containing protein n=1 Tax=Varanus komodoensis TaxID=61221 RepID=A0A8D2J4W3_VARKO